MEESKLPLPEGLPEFLQAWQHSVYNVCYQVLHHPEDAEDAAQEVLVKLAQDPDCLRDVRRLDRWIYRIALNTALNLRRRRVTRVSHEQRRADMHPAWRPASDLSDALHEAIADLDDDSRTLVLQHYFDHQSLETLAGNRNCAVVTVWKKIDRAKADLRRILRRIGFAAAAPEVDRVLQSIIPVCAPHSLVSDALLAEISRAATGCSTIAGGIAMTAKGLSLGATVGISVLLFGVGFGGGLLGGVTASEQVPVARGESRNPRGGETTGAAPRPAGQAATEIASMPASGAGPAFEARLERLRDMLLEGRRVGQREDAARSQEFYRQINEEWRRLRDAACADARTYFSFLRSQPDELFAELLVLLVGHHLGYYQSSGGQTDLQAPLVGGLKDLLASGTEVQRRVVLETGVFALRGAARAEVIEQCWSCLRTEANPQMRACLLVALAQDCSNGYDKSPAGAANAEDHLGLVEASWSAGERKESCLFLLSRMRSAAADRLFLEKCAEVVRAGDVELLEFLPQPLKLRITLGKPADENSYLSLVADGATVAKVPATFLAFADLLLDFPLGKATPAFERLLAIAPDGESRAVLGRVLERIRAGETRPEVLRQNFH